MKSAVKISGNQVQITRIFNAPREKVFAAWKTADQVERWSGCKDSTKVEVRMDFSRRRLFYPKAAYPQRRRIHDHQHVR